MGIELQITIDGEQREPSYIVPGEMISLSDYSNASRRVISVYCWEDDRGGEVFEFDNTGFEENPSYRAIDAAVYGLHNRIALIHRNKPYERTITTETRKQRDLLFRHTPGIPPGPIPMTTLIEFR